MDYLKEILAFEKWLETNPDVPPTAQALWYKLMAVNNKCYWQEWFQCANTRLMGMMNISSDKTLSAARVLLVEKMRIYYHEGSNRKIAGRYSIIPLVQYSTVKNTVEKEIDIPQESLTIEVSTVKNTVEMGALINKTETNITNEIKLELDEAVDIKEVLDFYILNASKDIESSNDRNVALELIGKPGMTFEYIKQGIESSKKNFKPKYKGDRMPFKYCKPAIYELHNAATERSRLDGRIARNAESNSGESTSGETGSTGSRADERTKRLIDPEKDSSIGDTDCNY